MAATELQCTAMHIVEGGNSLDCATGGLYPSISIDTEWYMTVPNVTEKRCTVENAYGRLTIKEDPFLQDLVFTCLGKHETVVIQGCINVRVHLEHLVHIFCKWMLVDVMSFVLTAKACNVVM